eukprot:gb/GFBE01048016.1/.p1 GENE.gb/GFBE01048016.1/~~gb/GFBE01048016.1/.p1  ORF type:complete len:433 (+),score=55.86 gb/GFBE01048016.1/:1-1299(+)
MQLPENYGVFVNNTFIDVFEAETHDASRRPRRSMSVPAKELDKPGGGFKEVRCYGCKLLPPGKHKKRCSRLEGPRLCLCSDFFDPKKRKIHNKMVCHCPGLTLPQDPPYLPGLKQMRELNEHLAHIFPTLSKRLQDECLAKLNQICSTYRRISNLVGQPSSQDLKPVKCPGDGRLSLEQACKVAVERSERCRSIKGAEVIIDGELRAETSSHRVCVPSQTDESIRGELCIDIDRSVPLEITGSGSKNELNIIYCESLRIVGSSRVHLRNLKVVGTRSGQPAVKIENSAHVTISGCDITGLGNGVFLTHRASLCARGSCISKCGSSGLVILRSPKASGSCDLKDCIIDDNKNCGLIIGVGECEGDSVRACTCKLVNVKATRNENYGIKLFGNTFASWTGTEDQLANNGKGPVETVNGSQLDGFCPRDERQGKA